MSDTKGNTIRGKYLVRNEGDNSKTIPGYFEIEIPKKITKKLILFMIMDNMQVGVV